MTPQELDRLLAGLAREPLPEPGPRFGAAVWNALDARRLPRPAAWEEWLGLLLRPRPVAAALAVAVLCGLGAGLRPELGTRPDPVARALDLGVFGAEAPGLPRMGR